MKKILILFFVIFTLTGCSNSDKNTEKNSVEISTVNRDDVLMNAENLTEKPPMDQDSLVEASTGYEGGMLQQEFLFVEGKLYVYSDRMVKADKLGGEIVKLGEISKEDSYNYPDEEFEAAHIPVGTAVYEAEDEIVISYDMINYRIFMEFTP